MLHVGHRSLRLLGPAPEMLPDVSRVGRVPGDTVSYGPGLT